MSELKPCPKCGGDVIGRFDRWTYDQIICETCGITMEAQGMGEKWKEQLIADWNTRPTPTADHMADVILSLCASRDEWKADAERLASEQLNAYDMMALDGVKSITDKGYLKLERALVEHNTLVEKEENNG